MFDIRSTTIIGSRRDDIGHLFLLTPTLHAQVGSEGDRRNRDDCQDNKSVCQADGAIIGGSVASNIESAWHDAGI